MAADRCHDFCGLRDDDTGFERLCDLEKGHAGPHSSELVFDGEFVAVQWGAVQVRGENPLVVALRALVKWYGDPEECEDEPTVLRNARAVLKRFDDEGKEVGHVSA